jgi:CRISPR-associated protein Cas6
MFWEEKVQKDKHIPNSVVDLIFDIKCPYLPVDHAYALSQAIQQALPWFEKEQLAGLHLIYGPEFGNGWSRPDKQDDLLFLSRRIKLILRLPKDCIVAAKELSGMNLNIEGYSLKLGSAKEKNLSHMPVLLARHILANSEQDEESFLNEIAAKIQKNLGIQSRKLLCGKTHKLKWPNGELFTRRLMIADLKPEESIILQEQGLGKGRKMGCGLFVPHKDIKAVDPDKS